MSGISYVYVRNEYVVVTQCSNFKTKLMDEQRVGFQVDPILGPLGFALGALALAYLLWLRRHCKTARFPPGPPCIPWLGPIPLRMRRLHFNILDIVNWLLCRKRMLFYIKFRTSASSRSAAERVS